MLLACAARGAEPAETLATADSTPPSARAGYDVLVNKPFLPSDFEQIVFDQVWQVWPEPLRGEAERSTPERRRAMAYRRYGLSPREGDPQQRPLQYVVDSDGNWVMNCFSCHGGSVYGVPYPGAPNNSFALQTLTEEIRATKFRLGRTLTRMDLGAYVVPLGSTVGRTNAVMFGVGLMHFRDPELNVIQPQTAPPMTHHDMDAPPWWHFHRKPFLYIDGFAERGHRGLMQFMLVKENGPEKFREWEDDFRDVYAYLMSLRPPRYSEPIDRGLAERGRLLFNDVCSRCHGTYGDKSPYPAITVPLDEVGTDPVRLSALPVDGRAKYAVSWFSEGDTTTPGSTRIEPEGYMAPPLDGIWASPPYFHNGSVPTLWHVLNPEERPQLWRRTGEAIDSKLVGFQIESLQRIPRDVRDNGMRREYFDTKGFGKSARGHDFGLELTIEERWAVLEYLKTL
jgi:mono/diheme cytochrome c family protein